MSLANNDAGPKDGEADKTDITHGVFLHAHYAHGETGRRLCFLPQKVGKTGRFHRER
jgi:hypothetical protein